MTCTVTSAATVVKSFGIASRPLSPSFDNESLEMIPNTLVQQLARGEYTDEVCLKVSRSVISEVILDGILSNKAKFAKLDANYDFGIQKAADMTASLIVKPRPPTPFSAAIQEAKATQTVVDYKVKRDERNITNISNILNSILKLKNIKKPLSKLPSSSEIAKKMKYETKLKLCEQ